MSESGPFRYDDITPTAQAVLVLEEQRLATVFHIYDVAITELRHRALTSPTEECRLALADALGGLTVCLLGLGRAEDARSSFSASGELIALLWGEGPAKYSERLARGHLKNGEV